MLRTKHFEGRKWFNLEEFWGATSTGFFRGPNGAKIKVRYGVGFLSYDGQKQTLDGETIKRLSVGTGSVLLGRMLIWLPETGDITYDVRPGNVAASSPDIRF